MLALAGCGGEEPREESGPRIDGPAAAELAELSDEVARQLDANDVCGAAHTADELKARAESEIADGSVPASLADELVSNAQALVDEVNCDEPPPPPPEDDEEGQGEGKGNGKGKGKDRGKDTTTDGDD